MVPPSILDVLSPESRACVTNLQQNGYNQSNLSPYPKSRLASVLVLLYEKESHLRVLLTTRSKGLRTHAGQTALPGGRADETDEDLFETAFREAHEEVALPLNCPSIYTIGTLEPFLSLHGLIVTPVLAFLADSNVLDDLVAAEGEVAHIFNHRLEAVLDPSLVKNEPLVPIGSEHWFYDTELYHTTDSVAPILGGTSYRMHRFRSSASPIKGLTADILIKVAEIAYGRPTTYERYAPDQVHGFEAISALALQHIAAQHEGTTV